jgi:formate dehydrogenase assembly factor FdhD
MKKIDLGDGEHVTMASEVYDEIMVWGDCMSEKEFAKKFNELTGCYKCGDKKTVTFEINPHIERAGDELFRPYYSFSVCQKCGRELFEHLKKEVVKWNNGKQPPEATVGIGESNNE